MQKISHAPRVLKQGIRESLSRLGRYGIEGGKIVSLRIVIFYSVFEQHRFISIRIQRAEGAGIRKLELCKELGSTLWL